MTVNPNWPPQPAMALQFAIWCTTPSGLSFPTYTGDQLTAFNDIQTAVGVPDLRWMYGNNLDVDINTLITNVGNMSQPANVTSADDWTTVKTQVLAELNAVSQVRELLAPTGNLPTFYHNVFDSESVNVAMVQSMLDAEASDTCSFNVFGMISDFLWALSAVGETAGAIINVAAAVAAAVSNGPGFQGVSGEVGAIQAQLLDQIDQMSDQAGQWLINVCGDWGNLQLVSAAILNGTLAWPGDPQPIVQACLNAYEIDLWQELLQLVAAPMGSSYTHPSNDANYNDPTCDCVTMMEYGWAFDSQFASNGTWNAYWLVKGSLKWWNPPQTSCDRIFGYLGVPKSDVMNGANGWPPPFTLDVVWDDPKCVPKH